MHKRCAEVCTRRAKIFLVCKQLDGGLLSREEISIVEMCGGKPCFFTLSMVNALYKLL